MMENINLSKKQVQDIASCIYGDIKKYCDDNFDRFFSSYLDERNKANGQPIEPITIKFYPCSYFDVRDFIKDTTVEKGEHI